MKRSLLSATSVLALASFGCGRAGAVPMAIESDSLLFGTTEQTDVVRESLSLGSAVAPLISGVARMPGLPDRPTIADISAQTPSATFTYRAAVPVRGDTGTIGSTAPVSRRNPGNVSNLKGTIGGGAAGLFSVPATQILVNETPARAYNYIFRPTLQIGDNLGEADLTAAVVWQGDREYPGHSVFVGVRSPVPDPGTERAARRVSVISATGSASPTILVVPQREAGANNGPAGPGSISTIGFSTAGLRPTPVLFGAAATTTLGYTYRPPGLADRRETVASAAAPQRAALSATIGAADGGLAGRDAWARNAEYLAVYTPVGDSTLGAYPAASRPATQGFAIETFAVRSAGKGPLQRVDVPLPLRGRLSDPADMALAVAALDIVELEETTYFVQYILAAVAVIVPSLLAFFIYRMIRRSALQLFE